jgi:hypothetical protein
MRRRRDLPTTLVLEKSTTIRWKKGGTGKRNRAISSRQKKYYRARTRAELSRHDDSWLGCSKGVDILHILSMFNYSG